MSTQTFEDNPFGEPMVDSFAPAATTQQHHGIHTNTNSTNVLLDNYSPFEEENNRTKYNDGSSNILAAPPTAATPQIPVYNQSSTTQSQSAYGTAAGGGGAAAAQLPTAELQQIRAEFERKEAELARREELLRNATNGIRRNNWPPLPEKCCFQPCFYQDIAVDIPSEFQKIVRQLYRLWIFYAIVMTANILGAFILMFHAHEYSAFGLSILYAFMFTPASFLCWYRPAYKAFRSDSSFNFMVFFFIFFFQLIVLIVQTIGIPGSGYCGFITAISQFDSSPSGIIVGLFILVIAMAFGVCTAGNVMLLTKIHSIYRHSESVSLGKAQAEFRNEFIHNQHVQRAAANATSAAVSSQFSNSPKY